MKQQPRLSLILAVAAATTVSALAGPAAPAPTGKGSAPVVTEKDWCKDLWELATLYKSDTNPIIQEIALTGRYHGQFEIGRAHV